MKKLVALLHIELKVTDNYTYWYYAGLQKNYVICFILMGILIPILPG
jgi:hypothetical protein